MKILGKTSLRFSMRKKSFSRIPYRIIIDFIYYFVSWDSSSLILWYKQWESDNQRYKHAKRKIYVMVLTYDVCKSWYMDEDPLRKSFKKSHWVFQNLIEFLMKFHEISFRFHEKLIEVVPNVRTSMRSQWGFTDNLAQEPHRNFWWGFWWGSWWGFWWGSRLEPHGIVDEIFYEVFDEDFDEVLIMILPKNRIEFSDEVFDEVFDEVKTS